MCKCIRYNNDCNGRSSRAHGGEAAAASRRMSENSSFLPFLFLSPTVWEQTSPCRRQAELRLSAGLWRVKEDGAEGGEDLPGSGRGQLALGLHHPHAVPLPQGQDQAEGRRAREVALPRGRTFAFAGGALQPLDAAVGHGKHGPHALALLRRQRARNQVTAVQRDSEDACEARRTRGEDSGLCVPRITFISQL